MTNNGREEQARTRCSMTLWSPSQFCKDEYQHPTETQKKQYKLQNQSPFVGNNSSFAWYCFNFHENWPTNIYNESRFLSHPSHTHRFNRRWNRALEPKRATLECLSFISCEHRYLQRGENRDIVDSQILDKLIYIHIIILTVYLYIYKYVSSFMKCAYIKMNIYNIDV